MTSFMKGFLCPLFKFGHCPLQSSPIEQQHTAFSASAMLRRPPESPTIEVCQVPSASHTGCPPGCPNGDPSAGTLSSGRERSHREPNLASRAGVERRSCWCSTKTRAFLMYCEQGHCLVRATIIVSQFRLFAPNVPSHTPQNDTVELSTDSLSLGDYLIIAN